MTTYARKREVPVTAGTKPKVCSRCDRWYAAAPRTRVCDGCRPRYARAAMAARKATVNAAKPQVSDRQKAALGRFRSLPFQRQLALAESWRADFPNALDLFPAEIRECMTR